MSQETTPLYTRCPSCLGTGSDQAGEQCRNEVCSLIYAVKTGLHSGEVIAMIKRFRALKLFPQLVQREIERIERPRKYNSLHEVYAVLQHGLDSLWCLIKTLPGEMSDVDRDNAILLSLIRISATIQLVAHQFYTPEELNLHIHKANLERIKDGKA